MIEITAEIKKEGPFFDRRKRIVRETTRDIVNNLIELGEQRLDQKLRPRPMGVFKTRAEAGKQASVGTYR
jgi:hypothetical protein